MREIPSHTGWLPPAPRYTPIPQRPSKHPLRRRPFQNCSRTSRDSQEVDRNSIERLCPTAEVCAITLSMQISQARRSGPYGYNLQKTTGSIGIPGASATTFGTSTEHRSEHENSSDMRLSQRRQIILPQIYHKSRRRRSTLRFYDKELVCRTFRLQIPALSSD